MYDLVCTTCIVVMSSLLSMACIVSLVRLRGASVARGRQGEDDHHVQWHQAEVEDEKPRTLHYTTLD